MKKSKRNSAERTEPPKRTASDQLEPSQPMLTKYAERYVLRSCSAGGYLGVNPVDQKVLLILRALLYLPPIPFLADRNMHDKEQKHVE